MEKRRSMYILLRDCEGYVFVDRSALGLQPKAAPAPVLKGDLLEALPQAEQPKETNRIALAGVKRKDLRLECEKSHVKELTVTKTESLLALSSAAFRYEKFLNIQDVGQQVWQWSKEDESTSEEDDDDYEEDESDEDEISDSLVAKKKDEKRESVISEAELSHGIPGEVATASEDHVTVSMSDKLRNLQEKLSQKESSEARLLEQLGETECEKKDLEKRLTRMGQRLTDYEGQLALVSQERGQFQKRLKEYQKQLLEKETQGEHAQTQLKELQEQFQILNECKERETCNLQEQLKIKREELNELGSELRDREQDIVKKETDLKEAKETLSKYELQLKTRDWIISRDEVELTGKCLGEGGWGIVLEGRYCDCPVAVKKLKRSTLTPQELSLFEREMDIASRCRHPCLLLFIGATKDENCPLFVTELMDLSLRALLGKRQLSETEVSIISLDVARALEYLHQRKPTPIIHRDVSSANVLLWKQNDQWRGKLSDYGTAKFVAEIMTRWPGAMIYAAPESGSSDYQKEIDVYSFGVLLTEMCLKNELPNPERREEQVRRVENKEFGSLIFWCIEVDPKDRPTMTEVIKVIN